jgi:Zn-dependent M28 family amino/carboxypeptidase
VTSGSYGVSLKIILPFILILRFSVLVEAGVSEESIRNHIKFLSVDLGERNYIQYQNLERAANYIKEEFKSYGYALEEQVYGMSAQSYRNIIATKIGKDKKDKIIIVCAHYDSVFGSPGADDNASGVAGLLELAQLLCKDELNKTVKFIAFTNEEPPLFMTDEMGSFIYAKEAKSKGEDIEATLCLESIGFYSDKKKSQSYPLGLGHFYPDKGNFIAVASNFASTALLKRIVKEFKKASGFPVEYLVAPVFFAPAISFSDNWSFWKFGYKAVMITDTAFYRNPYYHTPQDSYEKLNYEYLSRVIEGLYGVLLELGK